PRYQRRILVTVHFHEGEDTIGDERKRGVDVLKILAYGLRSRRRMRHETLRRQEDRESQDDERGCEACEPVGPALKRDKQEEQEDRRERSQKGMPVVEGDMLAHCDGIQQRGRQQRDQEEGHFVGWYTSWRRGIGLRI